MNSSKKIILKKKYPTNLGKNMTKLSVLKKQNLEDNLCNKKNKIVIDDKNNISRFKNPKKFIPNRNKIQVSINSKNYEAKKIFNPKFCENIKHFDKLSSRDMYICSVISKDFNINYKS